MGKPKRRKDPQQNSQQLSANTSDVGIALSKAPALLHFVERMREGPLAMGAFLSRY